MMMKSDVLAFMVSCPIGLLNQDNNKKCSISCQLSLFLLGAQSFIPKGKFINYNLGWVGKLANTTP